MTQDVDLDALRRYSTCFARGAFDGSARAQHSRAGTRYGSNLTDAECAFLEPLLPQPCFRGRPRQWPLREVMNSISYVLRWSCPVSFR